MNQNDLKQQAAQKAAELVKDGMTIGLGTGSTVYYLVKAIAQRVETEDIQLTGVATSIRTREQAESLEIPMKDLDEVDHIDLTIDGADEVDKHFQGIKGGGAAHLMEKVVAINPAQNIWIVDESKLVDTLGKFPSPLEVIPFGSVKLVQRLANEGLNPEYRLTNDGEKLLTDSITLLLIFI